VKHKKIKGKGISDKHNKRTLTPGGEEQVALLVFCNITSSVPRLEWDGGERSVVLPRPFLSLLYRIVNKGIS
jgi:hypothetical protein